jgi:hypothetical protein
MKFSSEIKFSQSRRSTSSHHLECENANFWPLEFVRYLFVESLTSLAPPPRPIHTHTHTHTCTYTYISNNFSYPDISEGIEISNIEKNSEMEKNRECEREGEVRED